VNWFKEFWKALNVPMPLETERSMESLSSFTPRAQQVLGLARKEADRLHHGFVGTEHLLLGLIHLGQGTAVTVLAKLGLDLETVRSEIEKQVGTGAGIQHGLHVPYTPRVKRVLALAAKEARELNHTYVGTEHILLGLIQEQDGLAARVLKEHEVDIALTRQEILKELDPNYGAATEIAPSGRPPKPALADDQPDLVDTTKRYDVHCAERDQTVVYRNALFKGMKKLFPKSQPGILSEFIELEQADGQTVFVARSSLLKFCPHVAASGPAAGPDI
jgi:hypothetical protein